MRIYLPPFRAAADGDEGFVVADSDAVHGSEIDDDAAGDISRSTVQSVASATESELHV
jgi:hypothetical protein